MSWVAVAVAAGLGTAQAVTGAVGAKKEGNRRRDLIYQAYQRGRERLDLRQGDVRQSQVESLGARGLTGGGDVRVGGAVAPGVDLTAAGAPSAPHTLGSAAGESLRREQGLEQNEMLAQRDATIDDTTAAERQSRFDSIAGGIGTAMSAYGAVKDFQASRAPSPTPAPSPSPAPAPAAPGKIEGAMGINNPSNWWGGIHGLDPLGAPGSSWSLPPSESGKGIALGTGQPNYAFNRSMG